MLHRSHVVPIGLRRDLAVYRLAKDNDRMTGLDKKKPDDQTDEGPPVV